jgi:replicative DNA helicase
LGRRDRLEHLEETLIRSILNHPDQFIHFYIKLKPEQFTTSNARKQIFETCVSIFNENGIPDIPTIKAKTKAKTTQNELKNILTTKEKTTTNFDEIINEFHDELTIHQLSFLADKITIAAENEETKAKDLLEEIESKFLHIDLSKDNTSLEHVSGFSRKTLESLRKKSEGESPNSGVMIGVDIIDRLTLGFQPSDLAIFFARPSMGKSELALQTCLINAADGVRSALFSLEMNKESLFQRMLAHMGEIDFFKLRHGRIKNWEKVEQTAKIIENLPIHIADGSYCSLYDIISATRRLKLIHNDLRFVVIDYIQLIHILGQQNREREIGTISRSLKNLAMSLDITVIGLSQASRAWAQRVQNKTNKDGSWNERYGRLQLSDMRDSGSLEQDADIVVEVYRRFTDSRKEEDDERGDLEILKQRNGPLGGGECINNVRFQKLSNLF